MLAQGSYRDRCPLAVGGDSRMSGSRLSLVADDQRFDSAIQTHLKKSLGQPAFECDLTTIGHHLDRDTDALLLLAAASTTEADRVYRLVQEICLQKLPPIIMIVERADAA